MQNPLYRCVVLGDLHIPYQDDRVLRIVLKAVKDMAPDEVVIIGDLLNVGDYSKWKNDLQNLEWDKEVQEAKKFLKSLAKIGMVRRSVGLTPQKTVWMGGNHEGRVSRYLEKYPLAAQLIGKWNWAEQFGLDKLGIKWVPCDRFHEPMPYVPCNGKCLLTLMHGALFRKHSAFTAKGHAELLGKSSLTGHCHRGGVYYWTSGVPGHRDLHVAAENFCLCRLDGSSESRTLIRDWHHGFSIVHIRPRDGWFHIEPVPIVDYKFVVNGRFYHG